MPKHPSLKQVFSDVPMDKPGEAGRKRRTAEIEVIGGRQARLLYERFGIRENAFGPTPDPRFLYESKTHARAKSSLAQGLEFGVGFQALISPPGMGKTTILFQLLQSLQPVARTAFIFQPHGDSRNFLAHLLLELGSEERHSDPVRIQEAINDILVREFRLGRSTVIVVDEAQNLDRAVLETIRLLSNFETTGKKLLQIILAGQPKLADRLGDPQLAQLQQRIPILATLLPFDLEDTSNYIKHRLQVAGSVNPDLFAPLAVRLIWENSGGIPRNINTLCFNAMLLARSTNQLQIEESILQEVVAERQWERLGVNAEAVPAAVEEVAAARQLPVSTRHSDGLTPRPIFFDGTLSASISEIARRVQLSTGADAVSVVLGEGGEMVCHVRTGNCGPEIDSRVNTETGLMGLCIRSGTILRCDDSEVDNRVNSAACREFGIRSIAYIPIAQQRSIIGVCGLLSGRLAAFQAIPDVQLQGIADEILGVVSGHSDHDTARVAPEAANQPAGATRSTESRSAAAAIEISHPANLEPARVSERHFPRWPAALTFGRQRTTVSVKTCAAPPLN